MAEGFGIIDGPACDVKKRVTLLMGNDLLLKDTSAREMHQTKPLVLGTLWPPPFLQEDAEDDCWSNDSSYETSEYDDEELSCCVKCRQRCKLTRKRRIWFTSICCILASLGILTLFVIPHGRSSYNERIIWFMGNWSQLGFRFRTICKFKQYNNGIFPSESAGAGRRANGRARSPDFLYLYHHEGVILELVNQHGLHERFVELQFNRYGLASFGSQRANVRDTMPWGWTNPDCKYVCGLVNEEKSNPALLGTRLAEVGSVHYNVLTNNCIEFSGMLWDFLDPQAADCGVPRWLNGTLT